MPITINQETIDSIASLKGLQKKSKINRVISNYREELEASARKLTGSEQEQALANIDAEIIEAKKELKKLIKEQGEGAGNIANFMRMLTKPLLDMNIYVEGSLLDGDDLFNTELPSKLDIRNPIPANLENEQLLNQLNSTATPEAFRTNYEKIKRLIEDKANISEDKQLNNKFPVNKYLGAIDVSKKKNRIELYDYWAKIGDLYDVFEDNLAEFFLSIERSGLPEEALEKFDKLYSQVAQENLEYIAVFENVEEKFLNGKHRFFNVIATQLMMEGLLRPSETEENIKDDKKEYADVNAQLAADMMANLGNSPNVGESVLLDELSDDIGWEEEYEALLGMADPLLMYEINRGDKLVAISETMETEILSVLNELMEVLDEGQGVSLDTTTDIERWFEELDDTMVLDDGDVKVMALPISVMTNSDFSRMYSTDTFKSANKGTDIKLEVLDTIKDFFTDLYDLLVDSKDQFQFEVKNRASKGRRRGSTTDYYETRGTDMEGRSANPLAMNQKGTMRPELEVVKQSLTKMLDSANEYYFDPLYSGLMPIQIPNFGSSIGAKVMQTMSLDLGLETVMTAAYDTISDGSSKEINAGDLDDIADFLDNIFMPSAKIDTDIIVDGEEAADALTRIFKRKEMNDNYCAALIHHYMEDLQDLSREGDDFNGKMILQRAMDFHEQYTAKKAFPVFAMPHWLDMNQGLLNATPALKRAYNRLKDIFENAQTDLPVLLHKLLKAHDMVRKELGMDIICGYNPLNDYGIVNVINKMQVEENIDLSQLEVEQIVKAVDSHKNISEEYGISGEQVYMVKALFR